MRLALVNPNTSAEVTRTMVEIARQAAPADCGIEGHTAPFGVPLIVEPATLSRAGAAVAALAPTLESADAAIVAAFGDPGLEPLRARLDIPVTGIAEAGMAEAARGGRRFAVATTTPLLRDAIAATASRYGHRRFAGTWTTPQDPAALHADEATLEAALARAVETAIRDGGAEAVVIGGGPLARAARSLAADLPVPLIEPLPAAIRLTLERLKERALR